MENSVLLKSKILMLAPYLDKDRIIRVGGKLAKADIPFFQLHPTLLKDCI